ncbi:LOW QUALITY PROTEIN: hypothetical protein PHMEG_00010351 [Phytophthora megakarya]|uniref:RNase H type-1 domain-containing protein n=1 Tax=Phytophthora megakarya TaxID=4795 RepID=A0A225WF96_9STRA|nr:LOW QUALITY PROTEIN: hypothetical protein PHMEG_00010351 [Phytophthora megakarya]
MCVFRRNIPAPSQMGPVLGRSWYIDDIAHGASTWDQLYEERVRAGRNLEAAKESFEILKRKIVSTPLLRHPDRTKAFEIIPHANPQRVQFWVRDMKDSYTNMIYWQELMESELRYYITEEEELTILRTLEWLLEYNTADGPHLKWGLELSRWTLEIHRIQNDEDGLAAILGSGINPREHLDRVAETLIPAKGRLKVLPSVSLEMLEADYQGYVLSFDGAAKITTRQENRGSILWKLPGWQVVNDVGHILEGVKVNDAEYHGLIMGLKFAMKYDVKELSVIPESASNKLKRNLQRHFAEYEDLRKNFVSVKLIHVKLEFNQAKLNDPEEIVHLRLVSTIPEKIMKPSEIPGTPAT